MRIAIVSLVLATPALAETHQITQTAFTWSPSEVSAVAGDTIQWNWTSSLHTVTSGIDCDPDGLFHMPLSNSNPTFQFVIPVEFSGDIPYFCTPHCNFGMTGVIHVSPAASPCPADIDESGDVGFADLLAALSAWGRCAGCAADVDGSGDVGFADVLAILADWGPCD